ncbi:MAG: DUF1800 family protein [Saprospiraceae bacterium]|nr:DUF1800 family protein [Saprospiraceae bacterium]
MKLGKPNENYARELMELCLTMGEKITVRAQFDVVEVARTPTGWKCNQYSVMMSPFIGSEI